MTQPPLEATEPVAWVRLDDNFFSHPKAVSAGRDARDLFLAGMCFCNRGLTDGFIPGEALRRLAADAEVDNAPALAAKLVEVGLWEATDGGYRIHQYLDYQPSKERVEAERAANAQRQAEWRDRKKEARNAVTNTVSNADGDALVTPAPIDNPSTTQEREQERPETTDIAPAARAREDYSQEFQAFWKAYGPTDGPKKPAYAAWKNLTQVERHRAVDALPAWLTSRKWRDGYKDYPQKYLNQRFWENTPDSGPARASPNGAVKESAAMRFARMAQEGQR